MILIVGVTRHEGREVFPDGDGERLDVFTDDVHLYDLRHRARVPYVDIMPAS
jgi:hypothetical protein